MEGSRKFQVVTRLSNASKMRVLLGGIMSGTPLDP